MQCPEAITTSTGLGIRLVPSAGKLRRSALAEEGYHFLETSCQSGLVHAHHFRTSQGRFTAAAEALNTSF
jgi:hypothetical protein